MDNFGIKYIGKENLQHLYDALRKETYEIVEDLEGNLYCGITLKWNYAKHHVDLAMAKYVMKQHTKYGHVAPGKKHVQQIVGSFLYYAQTVDHTILMALSEISSQQVAPTENTMKRVNQFLDYMWTHPDAVIQYRASDMILNVHSDASCLSTPKARSRASSYFFLGSLPRNGDPIKLNGAIHVSCTILKLVAASAAEAELSALF
jgi:hypothetical protein